MIVLLGIAGLVLVVLAVLAALVLSWGAREKPPRVAMMESGKSSRSVWRDE